MNDTPQDFTVNLLKEARFEAGGLRPYFQDRDLGIASGTHGQAMAVVHRACGPCPEGGTGAHHHRLNFQMNYMLKGWMQVEFGDRGVHRFEAGDSWLQPPEITHNVTAFSEDMEVLEITMPATFETIES
jgi:mannose-6-phosphate isomerase-like protein (cupin superfamily)